MVLIHLSIALIHVVLRVSCQDSRNSNVDWEQTHPSINGEPPTIAPAIEKPPCVTEECNEFVLKFKANIDAATSPCNDFYKHACGGWISHHSLQRRALVDQYTSIKREVYTTVKETLEKFDNASMRSSLLKAANYYKSCRAESDLEANSVNRLIGVINQAGGWPLIREPGKPITSLKWQEVHDIYTNGTDIAAFYQIGVTLHHKNSSMHIITIGPPDDEMNGLEFSSNPRKRRDAASNTAYLNYISEVASVISNGKRKISEMTFHRDVQEMMEFQKQLTALPDVGFDDDTDNEMHYRVLSIKDLQGDWNDATSTLRQHKYKVDWLTIIEDFFRPTNIRITEDEPVALLPGDYLMRLARLLMTTEKRIILNYIHWNAIHRLLKYTNKQMRDIRNRYLGKMFGAEGVDDRWITCVDEFQMEHALTVIMGHSDQFRQFQTEIRNMTEEIKAELHKEITESSWLNPTEKLAATLKVGNIEEIVGYPNWTRDPIEVDKYYQDLIVTDNDYLLNVLRAKVHRRFKELETLRLPVNKYNLPWDMRTFDFVATFDQQTNHIVVPAGLLEHPYIRFPHLPVTQWASLGSLIGHEIAHGFDNEGRLYDKDGNKNKWWSDASIQGYNRRANCFIQKYSGYKIKPTYREILPINGTLTLRENIADNLGFLMSFRAFEEHKKKRTFKYSLPELSTLYTEEKLWFYSLAHTFCENVSKEYLRNVYALEHHPPSSVRINGFVSGMTEFSDAFNCKDGDPMKATTSTICPIWGN